MEMAAELSSPEAQKISFITSNKGQLLMQLGQYLYRCHKTTIKKKYWVCIHNGCKVSVHTDINNTYLCGGNSQHGHEPNPEMIAARNVRQKIKERVLKETVPTTMIYEQEIANAPLNSMTLAILPTSLEMSTSVRF
jgi:hypothetical protein